MGVNFCWSLEGDGKHSYERGEAKVEAWTTSRFRIQAW